MGTEINRTARLLDELPADIEDSLAACSFDRAAFLSLAARLTEGASSPTMSGELTLPSDGDVLDLPAPGSAEAQRLVALGEEALRRGQCALLVLAGGMATRMGGVVKALLDAIPGHSFLALRAAEQKLLGERYGALPPLWLMTSTATNTRILSALGALGTPPIQTFLQDLSLRLSHDGSLFFDDAGRPSTYSPGHGDLPSALRRSGLLSDFRARGGRYVLVTNIDNLGAALDPLLVGLHLSLKSAVTCEVVDKLGSDRGGIPIRRDGRMIVLEEFRAPSSLDPSCVRVFNTNTFGFDADALAEASLPLDFHRVEKKVDGRTAIQFERLVGEVTLHLPTTFVRVPRSGEYTRFLPVKDEAELARREPEIRAALAARGVRLA